MLFIGLVVGIPANEFFQRTHRWECVVAPETCLEVGPRRIPLLEADTLVENCQGFLREESGKKALVQSSIPQSNVDPVSRTLTAIDSSMYDFMQLQKSQLIFRRDIDDPIEQALEVAIACRTLFAEYREQVR